MELFQSKTFLHVKDVHQEALKDARSASCPNLSFDRSGMPMFLTCGDVAAPVCATDARLAAAMAAAIGARPGEPAGVALHLLGQCTPCVWVWKPRGCNLGPQCNFCHACPRGTIKLRRRERNARLRQAHLDTIAAQNA